MVGRFFYFRKLISTCVLSIMIALGIQFIGKHFDNTWKTRCRQFSLLFPMAMKATGMPFYHFSNTIKVYNMYYKAQQLCLTFVNNDLVIIVYSKKEESIP
jgi:hypothetical protein